jgi:hypothetical protein
MANKFTDFNPGIVNNGGRKNFIINGDFKIWQRGTTFSNVAVGIKYAADRFAAGNISDGVIQISRSTSVPTFAASGRNWPYSHLMSVTTADTSIGASQYYDLAYKIEGYDIIPLMGRTCTLSFWSAATKTGIYCVALRNNFTGPDRSYIMEYTQAVASTWQFNKLIFTMHDGTSGTWDFTNGMGLDIWFMLAAGSTFATTPNEWKTGNYITTTNQVNLLDTIGNNFWITGVQLELGSLVTPFENRTMAEELALCQRYYEKSYEYATAIGTVTQNGMTHGIRGNGSQCSMVYYKVPKRTAATPSLYSPATGTLGQCRNYNSGTDQAASAASVSEKSFNVGNGSASVSDIYGTHWVCDADIN